jgi:predicted solute-binding protein
MYFRHIGNPGKLTGGSPLPSGILLVVMAYRLGLSPYLNAQPLATGLLGRPGVELVQAHPARLCDLLRNGWLDAGLVSSTEYFSGGYRIIPHGAISAKAPGADAVLIGNVPLQHMRTIALAHCSRSTNLLLRLVLHWLYPSHAITFSLRPADTLRALNEADGCLLIGDAALELHPHADYRYNITDLWLSHTGGRPAVLSCWLARPDADPVLNSIVELAAAEGRRMLPAIAQAAAAKSALSIEDALHYLSQSLDYTWTAAHAEALAWMGRELHRAGLIKEARELEYLGDAAQAPAAPVSNHAT